MVYNNNTLIIYKSQNFFQSQTHALHELDDLVSDDVIFSKATTEYFMEENPSAPPHGRCDAETPPLCVAAPCGGPERDRDSNLPLAHVVAVCPTLGSDGAMAPYPTLPASAAPRERTGAHTTSHTK